MAVTVSCKSTYPILSSIPNNCKLWHTSWINVISHSLGFQSIYSKVLFMLSMMIVCMCVYLLVELVRCSSKITFKRSFQGNSNFSGGKCTQGYHKFANVYRGNLNMLLHLQLYFCDVTYFPLSVSYLSTVVLENVAKEVCHMIVS